MNYRSLRFAAALLLVSGTGAWLLGTGIVTIRGGAEGELPLIGKRMNPEGEESGDRGKDGTRADSSPGNVPRHDPAAAGRPLPGRLDQTREQTGPREAESRIRVAAHGFQGDWRADGRMVLSPEKGRSRPGLRDPDPEESRVSLLLTGMGYGGETREVQAPERIISGETGLTGDRPGVSEWYREGKDGLEHGFTLERRPEKNGSGSEPLEIALAVESRLRLVEESGDSMVFMDPDGRKVWNYRRLVVSDRDGARVPAWMELHQGGREQNPEIRLCIAEAGAAYPLTVDPTFSSSEVASFPVPSSEYGTNEPPVFMVTLGETVLFFAHDGYIGNELWRTNRTTGETGLVKDIYPAGSGCSPTEMAVYKQAVWFGASDGAHGHQLWKSDGTAEGTVMFRDFSASGGTKVDNAVVMGGYLYFNVLPANSAYELWRTDGTVEGTVKVISPGGAFCDLREAVATGKLLIYSNPDSNGQLWRSDGTAEGTFLLTGSAGWPRLLTPLGDSVFFVPQGSGEIWKTDGTAEGTARLSTVADSLSGPPVVAGGFCYVTKTTGTGAVSLWRSDGGPFGLVRTVSTNPGSGLRMLGAAGGLVYFVYSDATEVALWKSDGTQAGTAKVLSFGSPDFARITDPMAAGNVLYFSGTTQAGGSELWKSDGTAAGTVMVKDIRPGSQESYPMLRLVSGNALYFLAWDIAAGKELWRTDGSAAGTVLVRDIYPDEKDKRPENMTAVGDQLYFSAHSPGLGRELWKSDGTTAGTVLVKDAVAGPGNGFSDNNPEQWTAAGNLLFAIPQPAGGRSLWRSDGTAGGTLQLKAPVTGTGPTGSQTHVVVPFNNLLLFPEGTSAAGGLWRSDGTVAGTFRLAAGGDGITVLGNTALFVGPDGNGADTLWKTDGTAEGTRKVFPARLDVGSPGQTAFRILDGRIYFSATDGTRGTELWKSDGTAEGTSLVADLTAGPGSSLLGVRAAIGSRIFFVKGTNAGGDEVWATDGTAAGTLKLATHTSHISALRPAGSSGGIFYYTPPGNADYELWGSNGTVAGTGLVKSFGPKNTVSGIFGGVQVKGRMVFGVSTPALGNTVWSTDGTPAGTRPILDLFPGVEASSPTLLGLAGGYVFFAATDMTHGRELWATDGTAEGTRMVEDLNPGSYSSAPYWVGELNGKLLAAYEAFPAASTQSIREIHPTPLPVLQGTGAEARTGLSARLLGQLDPDGAAGRVYFEYGATDAYGQRTPDQPRETAGPVEAVVEGLAPAGFYHFRPVFVTPAGTYYGADKTFTMPALQLFAVAGGTASEIMNGQAAPAVLPDTPEGTAAGLSLRVENGSGLPVTLSSLSLPAGYSLSSPPFPLSLPARGSVTFGISLLSPVPGIFTGQASLGSEAGMFVFPVSTTVFFVNDVPVVDAVPLRYTPEDTALKGKLSASDPDLQPLTFSLAGAAANGTAAVAADGGYTFTPSPDFHGMASFSVKVNDGLADSLPVTVTVEVLAVADPPVLMPLPLLSTLEDTAVSGQLAATSAEGLPLTYSRLSGPEPAAGTLSFAATGGFTFIPAQDYSGPASFTAVASDGILSSNPVAVFIYVSPVNDPPSLSALGPLTAVEGLPLVITSLTVTDPDNDAEQLRLTVRTEPQDLPLLPASAILLGGSGTHRMLALDPPVGSGGAGSVNLIFSLDDGRHHVSSEVPLRILKNVISIRRPSAAIAELQFTGIPGYTCQIQRSSDLKIWSSVGSSTKAGASGVILWTDSDPPPLNAFYRLMMKN